MSTDQQLNSLTHMNLDKIGAVVHSIRWFQGGTIRPKDVIGFCTDNLMMTELEAHTVMKLVCESNVYDNLPLGNDPVGCAKFVGWVGEAFHQGLQGWTETERCVIERFVQEIVEAVKED